MPQDTRPGWQTSEFYSTLLMHLFTVLTLLGVPAHFTTEQTNAIATVAALIGSAVAQIVYTHSRQVVKTSQPATGAVIMEPPSDTPAI